MTSKEALENWYNTQSPRTKAYEYEHHYRLIKKDLEILEILKPIIKAVVELKGISINSMDFKVSDNVKEIIKRWLDNDK